MSQQAEDKLELVVLGAKALSANPRPAVSFQEESKHKRTKGCFQRQKMEDQAIKRIKKFPPPSKKLA